MPTFPECHVSAYDKVENEVKPGALLRFPCNYFKTDKTLENEVRPVIASNRVPYF